MKKLLAPIVLVAALGGCAQLEQMFERSLPAETQARLESYDQALVVYDDAIKRTEEKIKLALSKAEEAAKSADWATTQAALQEINTLEKQHTGLVDAFNTQAAAARGDLKAALQPAAQGLLTLLDPLVPVPLQPLVPLASSLLVMLGSRRARKHTKRALRHAAVGQLGSATRDVMRAVGAFHSSVATQQLSDLEDAQEAKAKASA